MLFIRLNLFSLLYKAFIWPYSVSFTFHLTYWFKALQSFCNHMHDGGNEIQWKPVSKIKFMNVKPFMIHHLCSWFTAWTHCWGYVLQDCIVTGHDHRFALCVLIEITRLALNKLNWSMFAYKWITFPWVEAVLSEKGAFLTAS